MSHNYSDEKVQIKQNAIIWFWSFMHKHLHREITHEQNRTLEVDLTKC